jgi:methionyl-tRNA formyltransferase
MRSDQNSKVVFVGCKTTTLECMAQFLEDGFHIDHLVTLPPELAERNQVAGYLDLSGFASERGIPVYQVNSYSLSSEEDQDYLLELQADLLLVIGWQRLLPAWWLEALSVGAVGMHGSPEPLPRGRGRSPMNWALAQGRTSFTTNLFLYDAGVDSGAIVGSQRFDITAFDTCDTLHMKNRIAMNRLLKAHLPSLIAGTAKLTPQPTDIAPTYYPKRTSEDGRIIWTDMDVGRMHNHVRCQTRPFPGAFSHLDGEAEPFHIWAGAPFDGHLTYAEARPGDIVEIFHDGSFLVALWDGGYRVADYEDRWGGRLRKGMRFMDYPLCENAS